MIDWSKVQTAEDKAAAELKAEREARLAELLKLLRETDYVALADYDKDKPEVIVQRAEWRAEVRELEAELDELKGAQ
jgi:aminoglycoside phosphotransferase (APT) family kinase protein